MAQFDTLFTTLAANGNTAAVAIGAGKHEVDVYVGDTTTWGGGTLALQASPDGGTTWIAVPGTSSWTSGTGRLTTTPLLVYGATHIRLALSGATGPSITPQIAANPKARRSQQQFALAANGTVGPFKADADEFGVFMFGTWGGGTAKLQVSPDGGTTWYTLQSKTANSYAYVSNNRESLFQIVLSGATSPALTFVVE